MEIEIRYTFRFKEDGRLFQEITPLACLELLGDTPAIHNYKEKYWDIVARDLWINKVNKKGNKLYVGDIVKVKGRKRVGEYITTIVYTDGSASRFELRENKTYVNDGYFPKGLIEKIGDIHTTPELLPTD